MSKQPMRSILKGSTVTLDVSRGSGFVSDILLGSLSIWTGQEPDRDLFLRLEGQADDWMANHPEPRLPDPTTPIRSWWNLYRVGGFYAACVKVEAYFRGTDRGYRSPERAREFLQLIHKTIETFNFNAVYPECEFSQIAAALDRLGATVPNHLDRIEGTDSHSWNDTRIERAA